MKTMFTIAILALGLAISTVASVNTASAKSWQDEAFTPKGP